MRTYLSITLPVIVTFVAALYFNEVLKDWRAENRESEQPEKFLTLKDQSPYFDIGDIELGYTITIKNKAEHSTFDDIELLFRFYDRKNGFIDQKKETLSGPIQPDSDRTFKIQFSLKEALRTKGTVDIVNARPI